MSGRHLSSEQLVEAMLLVEEADSVELKLTVPDADQRSAVQALDLDPLDAQIRQVFFFDTPDLALDRAGVVVRGRRSQGRPDDSVVKLRPVVPHELPAELRALDDFGVEVDAMPGGFVCSASFKHEAGAGRCREVATGQAKVQKLLSKSQLTFFETHAPDGVVLDDLAVLGPILVLKLKTTPTGFDRKLVAELWVYPDGSRILELSTKCEPSEAVTVATRSRTFLEDKGIDLGGEQQTKTRTALDYFSGLLAGTD